MWKNFSTVHYFLLSSIGLYKHAFKYFLFLIVSVFYRQNIWLSGSPAGDGDHQSSRQDNHNRWHICRSSRRFPRSKRLRAILSLLLRYERLPAEFWRFYSPFRVLAPRPLLKREGPIRKIKFGSYCLYHSRIK